MKRLVSLLTAASLCLALSAAVFAGNIPIHQNGNIPIHKNGNIPIHKNGNIPIHGMIAVLLQVLGGRG